MRIFPNPKSRIRQEPSVVSMYLLQSHQVEATLEYDIVHMKHPNVYHKTEIIFSLQCVR